MPFQRGEARPTGGRSLAVWSFWSPRRADDPVSEESNNVLIHDMGGGTFGAPFPTIEDGIFEVTARENRGKDLKRSMSSSTQATIEIELAIPWVQLGGAACRR